MLCVVLCCAMLLRCVYRSHRDRQKIVNAATVNVDFSSFDEAWKVGAEGDVGAFWGLWDKDEQLKL